MQRSPEETACPLPLRKSSKRLRQLKSGVEPANSNEIWLITLSDLLMLLMIFFVFMLAVPYADSSLPHPPQAVLSQTPASETAFPPVERKEARTLDERALAQLERELKEILDDGGRTSGMTIERRPHAVMITFPEQILFDSGQANLKSEAQPTLAAVAALIIGHPEWSIEVQGHTDDRPIKSTRYPSNWELSADRAIQVAKVLVRRGADPVRIIAKGLGEFHPAFPNTSPEGRLKNRRVEIQFSIQPTVVAAKDPSLTLGESPGL